MAKKRKSTRKSTTKKVKKVGLTKHKKHPSHQHSHGEGNQIRQRGNSHHLKKTFTQDLKEGKYYD